MSKKTAKKSAAKTAKKPAAKASTGAASEKAAFSDFETTKVMEKAMTQGKSQFDKFTQEAGNAGKEYADLMMESTSTLMKGSQDIMKTWMGWAQNSAEKNGEALKSLLGCKTLTELSEAQNKLAQQNFDDFMKGATKLSELTVKVTTEALEPINDHVSKTVRKTSTMMAA